jgi:two-component sensor histidine kinase
MIEDETRDYRQRARELYERRAQRDDTPHGMDTEQLVQELRVHQIELELQNADLKKARDEAELSRDQYAALFDAAPIPYFVLDKKGRIHRANFRAADMLETPRSRLENRSLGSYFESGDRWKLEEAINRAGEDQPDRRPTLPMNVTQAASYFVEVSVSRWPHAPAYTDGDEEPAFLVGLSDVTIRQLRESEQTHAADYYRRLLREMNHRVKNNLMILSSIVDLERAREGSNPALDRISQRVRNVSRVHNALYEGSTDVDEVGLAATLRRFVQEFGKSLAAHVHIAFDAPDIEILMDSRRALALSLVLNELLSNAMQHAFSDGRAGKITVALSQPGESLRLVVTDNGVGMDGSMKPGESGGVGTQLVLQLVDELGGEWRTESSDGVRHEISVPLQ